MDGRERPEPQDDLDDEIRAHLDLRADDLVGQGLPPAEARRRARLEFGGVEGYKAEMRDAGRGSSGRLIEQLGGDIRVAVKRLRRAPLFVLFAAISIAAGVAITATVYALVRDLFWKSPGIGRSESLMVLTDAQPGGIRWRGAAASADVEVFDAAQKSLAVVGYATPLSRSLSLGINQEVVNVTAVTGGYFNALEMSPALGRLIAPADDAPDAPHVIVIDDRTWRRAFNADPGVVGQSVRAGDVSLTVVGVTRRGFTDLDLSGPTRARVWVATPAARALSRLDADQLRSRQMTTVIGRLRPGVTLSDAASETAGIGGALDRDRPLPAGRGPNSRQPVRRWSLEPMSVVLGRLQAPVNVVAYALIAIAALVLVVACTNIANLSLARGAARRHDLAIRRALGASRGRMIRELLLESALLAALGAVFSLVFLRALFALFTVELPVVNQNVIALSPELSWPVLAFSMGAVALALLVFGVQPALRLTRGLERADLAAGAPTVVSTSRGAWWLIRAQVGIAFAFMLLSAVAVQYVIALSKNSSGIDLQQLAVGTVVTLGPRWPEPAAREAIARILDRLKAQPGIDNAAAATGMPFGMSTTPYASVRTEAGTEGRSTAFLASTPELFNTLGIVVEKGRAFDARDTAGSPGVAVLSAASALELFGTTDVVGREIRMETSGKPDDAGKERHLTVVGVARDTDVQDRLSRRSTLIYVPFTQAFSPGITIAVRSSDPSTAVRALRAAVATEVPDLVVQGSGPAEEMLAPALPSTRVAAGVALVLGAITLLLAMIGLHGVLAYLLAGRTREMGLRVALGATSQQLSRLAMGQGLRPVAHGLIVGVVIGTLVRWAMSRMWRGAVSAVDPAAIVVITAFFLAAAWLACARPVRRASRVDPNIVLKSL